MPGRRLVRHAASRWAEGVTAVLDCSFDPKTVAIWAHAIGVSEGTLRDRCRVARCRPKRSLDLARVLRAVVQSRRHGWHPFDLLDIVSERTMKNLLERGGVIHLLSTSNAPTVHEFLLAQRFVTNRAAIDAVAERCAAVTGACGGLGS
jgi:hypothetical protein